MLSSVEHGVGDLTDLLLQVLLEDDAGEQVLLAALHRHQDAFLHPHEGQGEVVARVQLRRLAHQLRLAEAGHHAHLEHGEGEAHAEEGTEDGEGGVGDLGDELGVLEEA